MEHQRIETAAGVASGMSGVIAVLSDPSFAHTILLSAVGLLLSIIGTVCAQLITRRLSTADGDQALQIAELRREVEALRDQVEEIDQKEK